MSLHTLHYVQLHMIVYCSHTTLEVIILLISVMLFTSCSAVTTQDGLVCVFDTRHLSEDDSLTSVLNAEASVVSICTYCTYCLCGCTYYIVLYIYSCSKVQTMIQQFFS